MIKDLAIAIISFHVLVGFANATKSRPEMGNKDNNILKQDVSLIKIDCYDSENKDLCTRENIPGYPTIKIFKDGVYYKDYGLQRTADQLVYFALDLINGVA